METRANYILIGVFALAGFLGILGFFLWFARVELDRQFAYYDIRFSSVSGLSNASDVRFSGLPVGQVVDVRLSPDRDGTITVRVEVDAETPVRTDSVATIESLGVTGVSYVGIGPGSPDAPLLQSASDRPIPEIEAGRSTLQTLTEDAPALVEETLRVVREIGGIFTGENSARIERIIVNAEEASETFASTLEAFSGVADTVDEFAQQINRFNTTLDALTAEMNIVLASADETLNSIDSLAEEATVIVQNGSGTVSAVQAMVSEAQRYIGEDLSRTTTQMQDTLAALRGEVTRIGDDTGAMLAALEETGTTATARLREAETTLQQVDALIATLDEAAVSVEAAATRIDGLIVQEGAPLLAETRVAVADATQAIAAIRTAAETDLPAVLDDVTAAVENARAVIETVGSDLTEASGDVSGLVTTASTTMTQVTETFANANQTLSAINGALETGERTLAAAESAFTGADRVINEDVPGLIAELETTVRGLNEAVGEVSDDLPAISSEVRAASEAASQAFVRLGALVDSSAPGVQDFTTSALPLFSQLAQETRALIGNLDRLTRQIERSPTQFLLDRDVPEFRR
ncbi:MlaD family protein [Roseibacterium sp. SDUM158017]|uniref:MlaD family protein n=1 Tax=Roseicyclus salinarum TaxID=3036773 RepID=UPI0024153FFC|nr:MlaD family protein [Roseibacterium sp. SDUM158017]MDG4648520.1 MlaD family protein [Roseibacterium sp. SDUM158017]